MSDSQAVQATSAALAPAVRRPSPRDGALSIVVPLAAAGLVCILVVLAIATARSAGLVAAFWVAGGVAIVAWLRGPRERGFDFTYGAVLATAFLAGNLLAGNSVTQSLLFALANMIEVTTAVLLVRRFAPEMDLRSVRGMSRFLLATSVVAPIPAAAFAAGWLSLDEGGAFWLMFGTWWFGHALGAAAITTVGMSLNARELKRFQNPVRLAESVVLVGTLALAGGLIFFRLSFPIAYVLTPLLILVAARLRLLGAAVAVLLLTVIAIYGTLSGAGPYQLALELDPSERVRLAQLFMIMGCMPALLVAALLEERDDLAARARADQARAERASEGKSRLLANVSHEIKSPISGVIGIGELWRAGKLGPVSETQAEMSDMLVKTARQIEALARDLLDVAQAEAGTVSVDLRPVDVGALLEDVRRTTGLMPEASGLRLVIEAPPDRTLVRADSVRLSQVMTNLATNAVKYGREGGAVIFRVQRPTPQTVRLSVVDFGPGLTPERKAQLFEPFNRLGMEKSTIEGHGIGLALARRLVELQRGTIGVNSTPGQGAEFWVELPAG